MMRLLLAAVLLCAAGVLARATVVQALPFPTLVAKSQKVVLGRVVSMESAWDPSGMRIFTRCQVDVTETLKGDGASGITLFSWGGTVGEVAQRVVGEGTPQPGDEAVFFLEDAPIQGTWRLVGMAQGLWPVSHGADGGLVVSRKASRLTLRTTGPWTGHASLPDAGEKARPYAAFRTEVLQLTAGTP